MKMKSWAFSKTNKLSVAQRHMMFNFIRFLETSLGKYLSYYFSYLLGQIKRPSVMPLINCIINFKT